MPEEEPVTIARLPLRSRLASTSAAVESNPNGVVTRDVVVAVVMALPWLRLGGVKPSKGALSEWRADYDYYNFLETPADADAVLPRASAERLREIKAIYDPDQTIVSARPVRPADD
jgi:hypothetical protein